MKSFNASRIAVSTVLAAAAFALAQAAAADPVHITAQATVNGSISGSQQYMALGTVVSIDLHFDISGAPPASPTYTAISGEFRWNDGMDRLFTVNATGWGYLDVLGEMSFAFAGSGPTINGHTPTYMGLVFDLGLNPFTATAHWSDLLQASTITGFQLGADVGTSGYLGIIGAASGTITVVQDANGVPEPATLALVSLAGLAGLTARRRALQA